MNNKRLHSIKSIENYFKLVYEHNGFSKNLMEGMKVLKVEYGYLEVEAIIKQEFTNIRDIPHGGYIQWLLDFISSITYLSTLDIDNINFGVTVNMNTCFISSAKIDDKIKIISEIQKITNNFIFCNAKIVNFSKDNSLIAISNVIFKVPPPSKL